MRSICIAVGGTNYRIDLMKNKTTIQISTKILHDKNIIIYIGQSCVVGNYYLKKTI